MDTKNVFNRCSSVNNKILVNEKLCSENEDSNLSSSTSSSFYPVSMIISLLIVIISAVYMLYKNVPEFAHFIQSLSTDESEVQKLAIKFSNYTNEHYYVVRCLIPIFYILLQAFAIPGSFILTLISGYLFPLPIALIIVCLCSSVGASLCYMLSHNFGRKLVFKYFPEKSAKFTLQVAENRDDLLNYMLFLRITPIVPNWIINIVSPLIDIPLKTFFWGTFVGVLPPSFIQIQTIKTIDGITSKKGSIFWNFLLIVLAVMAILPVIYNRLKKKIL